MTTIHDKKERHLEPLSRFSQPDPQRGRCDHCGGHVQAQGRRRKRFCCDLCRTRFHYARRLARQDQLKRRLIDAGTSIDAAKSAAGVPEPHLDREQRDHQLIGRVRP